MRDVETIEMIDVNEEMLAEIKAFLGDRVGKQVRFNAVGGGAMEGKLVNFTDVYAEIEIPAFGGGRYGCRYSEISGYADVV